MSAPLLSTPTTPRHAPKTKSGLSSQQIWAIYQDFEIEASSHVRNLGLAEEKRLQLFDEYCKEKVDKLDKRVRKMSVGELMDEYGFNISVALKDTILLMLRPVETLTPEESERHKAFFEARRKRNLEGEHDEVIPPGPKRRTRSTKARTATAPKPKILKKATVEEYEQQLAVRAREMKRTWVQEMEELLSESSMTIEEKGNLMLKFFDFRQF